MVIHNALRQLQTAPKERNPCLHSDVFTVIRSFLDKQATVTPWDMPDSTVFQLKKKKRSLILNIRRQMEAILKSKRIKLLLEEKIYI